MSTAGLIYFVQSTIGGPIKIGFSASLAVRLDTFQLGCPFRLEVLCTMPGTLADEATLHRRFRTATIRGEWFDPAAPDLVALVAALGGRVREARCWDAAADAASIPDASNTTCNPIGDRLRFARKLSGLSGTELSLLAKL